MSVFKTSMMKDDHTVTRLVLLCLILTLHACQVHAEDDGESGSSEGEGRGLLRVVVPLTSLYNFSNIDLNIRAERRYRVSPGAGR